MGDLLGSLGTQHPVTTMHREDALPSRTWSASQTMDRGGLMIQGNHYLCAGQGGWICARG